jgi:ATP-binding cassette, subfamily C, bacterial LapB
MTTDSPSASAEVVLRALASRPPADPETGVRAMMERLEGQFSKGPTSDGSGRRSEALSSSVPPRVERVDGAENFVPGRETQDDFFERVNELIAPATDAETCIAPLLAAVGWAGDLREVREALPHFDRVNNIEELRSVVARLGFETKLCHVKAGAIESGQLPAILERINGARSLLVEKSPDGPLLAFDAKEEKWSKISPWSIEGRIYSFSKLPPSVDPQKNWLRSVINHFKPLIAVSAIITLLSNLAALAVPVFVVHVYDFGIGTHSTNVVFMLALGAAIVIGTDSVLRYIRARTLSYFGSRLDALISMSAFQQLTHMPISMVETAAIGVQISRLRQFEGMRDVFTGTLATAIVDIPFIFVFLIAIAMWGGHLVWVPVVLLAIFIGLALCTLPLIRQRSSAIGDAKQRLLLLLREIVGKRHAIRSLNAEDVWIRRHRELLDEWANSNQKFQALNNFVQNVAQSLVSCAGVAALALGTVWVLAGSMSLGALIGVMSLVWRVLSPLQSVFLSMTRFDQAIQTVQQINRIMSLQTETGSIAARSFQRLFHGHVILSRLVFRYPRRTEPALRGIQLDIKAGQIVAITGPSGSGKSTLLKLILGLYTPTGGAVFLDGNDLRQVAQSAWRSAAAYLPERVHFFYGTVAQNLRLSKPDATDAEIVHALESVGISMDLALLPDGVETRLTASRIESFPDAMKQRIGLARCFIKKAPIYLLDNPGSNLDANAASLFMKKLEELKGKSTVIMTTFRPGYMKLADRVIVLNDGVVVGDGPPEKILEKLYAAA